MEYIKLSDISTRAPEDLNKKNKAKNRKNFRRAGSIAKFIICRIQAFFSYSNSGGGCKWRRRYNKACI
jgi:hypothetical protein